MIRYLAEKVASYIMKHDDSADYEVLVYGYDLLFQEICVIVITLLLAIPFELFFYTLISLFSYNLLRRYAGGLHAKHRIVCIATSVLVMYGPAFLFGKIGWYLPLAVILVLYLFSLTLLLFFAPADTEMKPIQNSEIRKKTKIKAVICLSLLYGAALLIQNWQPGYASVLSIISAIVCCFTHPLAYKLYGCAKSKNITLEVSA